MKAISRREVKGLLNWERKRLETVISYIITSSPIMSDDQETIEHFEQDLENQIERLRKVGLCFLKYNHEIDPMNPVVNFSETIMSIKEMKERLEDESE